MIISEAHLRADCLRLTGQSQSDLELFCCRSIRSTLIPCLASPLLLLSDSLVPAPSACFDPVSEPPLCCLLRILLAASLPPHFFLVCHSEPSPVPTLFEVPWCIPCLLLISSSVPSDHLSRLLPCRHESGIHLKAHSPSTEPFSCSTKASTRVTETWSQHCH